MTLPAHLAEALRQRLKLPELKTLQETRQAGK